MFLACREHRIAAQAEAIEDFENRLGLEHWIVSEGKVGVDRPDPTSRVSRTRRRSQVAIVSTDIVEWSSSRRYTPQQMPTTHKATMETDYKTIQR